MANIDTSPYTFEHKTINAQEMIPKKIVKPTYIRSNITSSPLIYTVILSEAKDLKTSKDSSEQLRVSHPTPSLAKQETGNLTTMRTFAQNDGDDYKFTLNADFS